MESSKKEPKPLGWWWPPIIVAFGVAIYFLVSLNFHTLPQPLMKSDESADTNRFIAERAANHTSQLAALGPKVVGSRANEIDAINFLHAVVEELIAQSAGRFLYQIEVDVQVASGSLQLGSTISTYQGIQNFIVKLSEYGPNDKALLVNSHFDSVPISNGAGDDSIMVAVMLEVLRVLSHPDRTDRYGTEIIFLFNGAEENGLQGSHAFITQHPWAQRVKAFVNLDSAGTGGREMLFQTSKTAPWLIQHYQRSVPHPFGIIVAQEMFDAAFIPSDTDFRIFRDFGRIPGVDMALAQNGYFYHTKYDRAESIPMGTYQHVGDNVLALVKSLVNADEILNPQEEIYQEPRVYFDYLGWFMINYSLTEAIVINSIVFTVALSLIVISLKFMADKIDKTLASMICEFLIILVVQLVTIVLAAAVVMLLATIYDAVGRSMSWFSYPWILFGIYLCPFSFVLGIVPTTYVIITRRMEAKREKGTPTTTLSYKIQMFLHAQCTLLSLFSLVMTIMQVKTAFLLYMIVLFYALAMIINLAFRLLHHDRRWMISIFLLQILPFMFYSCICIYAMEIFIPIQGRGGPQANPETMIAMVCIILGLLQSSLVVPCFCLCKRPIWILSGYLVIFVAFIIVMATPAGFPYTEAMAPQRFWIFHTDRTFHSLDGSVRKQETGYLMLGMDRHQNDFVLDAVPELAQAQSTRDGCAELYCGLPLFSSRMFGQMETSHWVPAAAPTIVDADRATIQLIEMESVTPTTRRYTFEVTGPDHMAFYLSPALGMEIFEWSISEAVVRSVYKWNGRSTYYIFFSYAVDTSAYRFSIDLVKTTEMDYPVPALDVVVTAHYIHHEQMFTQQFQSFVESFPKWAHVTPWISTYEAWEY